MLFVMVLGFILCWFFVFIIEFMDVVMGNYFLLRKVYFINVFLVFISVVINLVIYGVFNRFFCVGYCEMFLFCGSCLMRVWNI